MASAAAHERYQFESVTSRESTVCQAATRHHLFVDFDGERTALEPEQHDQIVGC